MTIKIPGRWLLPSVSAAGTLALGVWLCALEPEIGFWLVLLGFVGSAVLTSVLVMYELGEHGSPHASICPNCGMGVLKPTPRGDLLVSVEWWCDTCQAAYKWIDRYSPTITPAESEVNL